MYGLCMKPSSQHREHVYQPPKVSSCPLAIPPSYPPSPCNQRLAFCHFKVLCMQFCTDGMHSFFKFFLFLRCLALFNLLNIPVREILSSPYRQGKLNLREGNFQGYELVKGTLVLESEYTAPDGKQHPLHHRTFPRVSMLRKCPYTGFSEKYQIHYTF